MKKTIDKILFAVALFSGVFGGGMVTAAGLEYGFGNLYVVIGLATCTALVWVASYIYNNAEEEEEYDD